MFFGVQLYVVSNYYFITGWDAGVLCDAARGIAEGQTYGKGSFLSYYFSTYPNNLFLLSVFSGIMKLDRLFGFLDVESGIMGILTVQCHDFGADRGFGLLYGTSVEVLSQDGLEQLGALCVLGRDIAVGLNSLF